MWGDPNSKCLLDRNGRTGVEDHGQLVSSMDRWKPPFLVDEAPAPLSRQSTAVVSLQHYAPLALSCAPVSDNLVLEMQLRINAPCTLWLTAPSPSCAIWHDMGWGGGSNNSYFVFCIHSVFEHLHFLYLLMKLGFPCECFSLCGTTDAGLEHWPYRSCLVWKQHSSVFICIFCFILSVFVFTCYLYLFLLK